MNTRIKELLSNTLLFTVANLGSKILVFLMVPLYTAVLSTKEYGIADMVQATAQMLFPVLTVMISEAVLRFCFLKDYTVNQTFSIGIRISTIGVFLSILVSVILYHISYFDSLNLYVFLIPVLFACTSFMNLFHKFARGIDKVKVSAIAGLINTILIIVLNLLFLLVFRLGVLGYLLAYICGEFFATLYMACKCNALGYYEKGKNIHQRNQMLKYSAPLVPNSLSWWALTNFNRYIMLAVLGVSDVGVYSATLRIPSILTVMSDIFAQAWLLSALKNYGDEESKKFIRAMYNRFFSLLIILTSLMIILAHPIASLLLTGEFSEYWYVSTFLFISVFFGALVGFLGSIFSAERKNIMQFVSTIIGAFVSIIITVCFIKTHGVIVVSIATMVGYFVIWLIRRIAVKKYIEIGYSIQYSIIQGLLLLVESVLVCKDMYVWAAVVVVSLVLLNHKYLYQILAFSWNSLQTLIHNRLIK